MEAPAGQQWFLRKQEDGSIFGPLSFDQLAAWANSAQVAPNDSLSSDQTNWIKAPMLPELGMDWIVEITSERYYGPTTLGAISEFMRLQEIGSENFAINACDGTRLQIKDLAPLFDAQPSGADLAAAEIVEVGIAAGPNATSIAVGMHDRIRELEEALRDERRALQESEERYRSLEAKYLELLGSRSTL